MPEMDGINLTHGIRQVKIQPNMEITDLIDAFSGCAFGAGKLAKAVDICEKMLLDKDCVKFFGLAGAMVPAGMRQIIADLIRDHYIDILVTTGANLVHDIIESLGLSHYKGTNIVDDTELRRESINRIYDVYIPEHHFSVLEEKLQAIFDRIEKKDLSIRKLLANIGEQIADKNSILRSAYDSGVPIYCPAIQDSILGLQAWLYKEMKTLNVDVFADMRDFIDRCYEAKRAGTIIIGGGVPKNFILQSMLVAPKEFDYAVQLTMDRPEAGGLSGATLEEARSWGKVGAKAQVVTVYSDATITLPIIAAGVRSRLANLKK